MARAYVGTSGWAYATWKPLFYPAEVKTSGLLRHYATRLPTTEVNYTFRHLPTEKTAAGWLAATPPDFTFALKASERITHMDRLKHPADTLPLFVERARLVGDRLGPILFQTPPTLKRDDDVLAGFVASLPADQRCAIEVRHPSWYAPEVYELLATRGIATDREQAARLLLAGAVRVGEGDAGRLNRKPGEQVAPDVALALVARPRFVSRGGEKLDAALTAFKEAEPVIMRAAQRGVVHKNNASRKVSRLAHRIGKLGK